MGKLKFTKNLTLFSGKLKVESGKSGIRGYEMLGKYAQPTISPDTNHSTFQPFNHSTRKIAFTLAEVLITLAVIGVVAAVTLPNVIKNYQKQEIAAKLKKTYSTFGQLAVKSSFDNDYTIPTYGSKFDADSFEQYFENYYFKYLKNIKIQKNKAQIYSTSTPYKYQNGNTLVFGIYTNYREGRVLFTTSDNVICFISSFYWDKDENGKNIALYNPSQTIYVDLNGTKQPNMFGKDVFSISASFTKGKVNFTGFSLDDDALKTECKSKGTTCGAWIQRNNWKIPDDYPW